MVSAQSALPNDYYCVMKFSWPLWSFVIVVGGAATWALVVHESSNSLSVRIGSWAQLLAAAGTLGAAALALSTARENSAQAQRANEALASATRPQFSVHMLPMMSQRAHMDPDAEVALSISNLSKFDAPRIRVNWTTKDGIPHEEWIDRLLADPGPSKGLISEHVSYSGDASTSAYVRLGEASALQDRDNRVRLYYVSQFGTGGWMEMHRWETWNTSDDPNNAHWQDRHTVDPPKWMTLRDMGF